MRVRYPDPPVDTVLARFHGANAKCDESTYYNSTTSYLGNDGDSDSGKTEVPAKEVTAPSNAALANGDEGESGVAEESADIEAGGSGENVA
ncbi:hypothetical protein FRB93_005185 [Tulasnella sp. JGI-2019a]|nr:hypothetical protein FRB93_005185 [Tulasnella sp. JGI-2019a]